MVHIQKFIMRNNLEISKWEGTEGCALCGKGLCIESFWNHLLLFWRSCLNRRKILA